MKVDTPDGGSAFVEFADDWPGMSRQVLELTIDGADYDGERVTLKSGDALIMSFAVPTRVYSGDSIIIPRIRFCCT